MLFLYKELCFGSKVCFTFLKQLVEITQASLLPRMLEQVCRSNTFSHYGVFVQHPKHSWAELFCRATFQLFGIGSLGEQGRQHVLAYIILSFNDDHSSLTISLFQDLLCRPCQESRTTVIASRWCELQQSISSVRKMKLYEFFHCP